MSTKPNYFKIGLFVIISTTLIVVSVVIWGAGLFTKDKLYFETYFNSAVSGLEIGAPVELSGVKIGQVEDIGFASEIYQISEDPTVVSKYEQYVRVLCSVTRKEYREQMGSFTAEQRKTRIKNWIQQGLRLRLSSNILTGQAYLKGVLLDPERFPPLDITWQPIYTYIPSAQGAFSTMKDSVDRLLVKLEDIDIQAISDNINVLLVELKELLQSRDPNGESANLPQVVARMDSILERIDRQLANSSSDVDKFILNAKLISDDIKELTAMLKKHPSEIIFSKPPEKSELVE